MLKSTETYLFRYLLPVLLCILVFLIYSRALSYGFISVWDDNINVLNNAYIKDFSWKGISTIFSPFTQSGEPRLVLFMYAALHHFGGTNPLPYHLMNILFHILNLVLVFLIGRRLNLSAMASLVFAALFAFHPFRVESVVWISGLKDVMYSFFFFLAIIFYLNFLKKQQILWLLAVMICTYLSGLSKIQAVSLPLILLLFDIYKKRSLNAALFLEKLMIALLAYSYFMSIKLLLLLIFAYFLMRAGDSDNKFLRKLMLADVLKNKPLKLRIFLQCLLSVTAIVVFAFILQKAHISMLYNHYHKLMVAISVMFILWYFFEKFIGRVNARSVIGAYFKKYIKYIIPAAIALVVAISFAFFYRGGINLWQNDFQHQYSIEHRIFMALYALVMYAIYAFFPFYFSALRPYPDFGTGIPTAYYITFIGAIVLFALFLWFIIKKPQYRRGFIYGFLFFFINIFLVMHIIPIEGRVVMAERYTYMAYSGLFFIAALAFDKGRLFGPGLKKTFKVLIVLLTAVFMLLTFFRIPVWKDEMSMMNEFVGKNPAYSMAYLNRSNLFINRNDPQNAISDLNKAISLQPDYYQAYYNRALAYSLMGDYKNAINDCNACLKLKPGFADALYLRGYSLSKTGKYTAAICDYSMALEQKPEMFIAYYNRGNARIGILNYHKAIDDFNKSLALNNTYSETFNARGTANFLMGNYEQAENDYSEAILLKPGEGRYYYNRGLARKAMNLKSGACADFETAQMFNYNDAGIILKEYCGR